MSQDNRHVSLRFEFQCPRCGCDRFFSAKFAEDDDRLYFCKKEGCGWEGRDGECFTGPAIWPGMPNEIHKIENLLTNLAARYSESKVHEYQVTKLRRATESRITEAIFAETMLQAYQMAVRHNSGWEILRIELQLPSCPGR